MLALKSLVSVVAFATFSAAAQPSAEELKQVVEANLQESTQLEVASLIKSVDLNSNIKVEVAENVLNQNNNKAEQPITTTQIAE
ncbi:hypothetical protein [Catenovulum sediminis]|uniref:Uncharacterized protein n=1 Tax=Catenovulum sediminis TaxID=1740262 RepID=A0ABV1RLX4_9ALTE